MTLSRAQYLERWSALHGNASPSRIVRGWLAVAYALASPLARMRVAPDAISLFGVVAAVAALELSAERHVIAAASIIVLSLILDGLDGAVAVLRQQESAWGAVFDSFIDRIAEALWAGTLVVIGVPIPIALAAWILAMVQEYQRARFASLDHAAEPIRVSVCERPVRALIIAAAVLMADQSLPLSDVITPTVVASIWLVLQTIGAMQVWRSSRTLDA